jgi:predicted ArsR family transcriptional regulator
MPANSWDQRFFATTRGQIVQRLRRGAATVEELALALQLTDNAIRAQLALLERDGLVAEAGQRRTSGSRKPSQEYRLTVDADRLFPKPYAQVLGQLLVALRRQLGRGDVEAAVREVGRRMADQHGAAPTRADARQRLRVAVDALNELGGLAEVEEGENGLSIRGLSCPLAAVVTDNAEVCHLTESFIGVISGLTVCERCERGASPHCRFDVVAS